MKIADYLDALAAAKRAAVRGVALACGVKLENYGCTLIAEARALEVAASNIRAGLHLRGKRGGRDDRAR